MAYLVFISFRFYDYSSSHSFSASGISHIEFKAYFFNSFPSFHMDPSSEYVFVLSTDIFFLTIHFEVNMYTSTQEWIDFDTSAALATKPHIEC